MFIQLLIYINDKHYNKLYDSQPKNPTSYQANTIIYILL
jgi:hypothetical protein